MLFNTNFKSSFLNLKCVSKNIIKWCLKVFFLKHGKNIKPCHMPLWSQTVSTFVREWTLVCLISQTGAICLITSFHIWKSLECNEPFKLVRIGIYLVKVWIYVVKIWIHLVKIWIHLVKIWIYVVKIWNSLSSTVLTLVGMDRINICARDTGPRWRIELCPSLEKRQSGRRYIIG